MPELDLPLSLRRAPKVTALLALAHHEGLTVPMTWDVTSFASLEDLSLSLDTGDDFAAWSRWLSATPCRDYPGSPYVSATATAHLDEWGPVTVRLSVRKDA